MLKIFLFLVVLFWNKQYEYQNIMQQQYYSFERYFKYIKNKNDILEIFVLSISILLYYLNSEIMNSFFLLFLLIINFPRKRKEIIPMKFTNRIIRSYICYYFLLLFFSYIFTNINGFVVFVSFLLLVYKYFFLISFSIENILEFAIKEYYFLKAKKKLNEYKPFIIAITGSFGKTSVKQYLNTILSNCFDVLATPKSYNTIQGITKTINNQLKRNHRYFIIEVGVDKKKGMDKFLKLFKPDIAIITGIAPQHLSTFKSVENIVNEKMKLAFAANKVFLNGDCQELIKYKNDNFIFYSINDIAIKENIFLYNNNEYQNNIFGSHLILNIIGCIKVCEYLNVPVSIIKEGVKKLKNAPHRYQLILKDNMKIIDNSYNSNFYSFNKSLESFSKLDGYKIIITPGLIELGKDASHLNTEIAKKCLKLCDKIVLVGDNKYFKNYLYNNEKFITFASFKEAYDYANKLEKENKNVLIENDLPDVYIE